MPNLNRELWPNARWGPRKRIRYPHWRRFYSHMGERDNGALYIAPRLHPVRWWIGGKLSLIHWRLKATLASSPSSPEQP